MKTLTFGVLVIACACLFSLGTALAQTGSDGGSTGSGVSGMTSQGLASEPAGIGEKGTGQTQSTLERSGVPAQKGMTSEQAGQPMEQAGSPMPSGVGEKGTGQTQSTVERSGGQQGSGEAPTSQSQSAMERPQP